MEVWCWLLAAAPSTFTLPSMLSASASLTPGSVCIDAAAVSLLGGRCCGAELVPFFSVMVQELPFVSLCVLPIFHAFSVLHGFYPAFLLPSSVLEPRFPHSLQSGIPLSPFGSPCAVFLKKNLKNTSLL